MKVSSPDLNVNKRVENGIYLGSSSGQSVHNVRWNSNSRCMEYEQCGWWYTVPEDTYDIQLPPELANLTRWCRNQSNYPYDTVIANLLEWIKNTKDRVDQTKCAVDNDPTLQDAWQQVEAALDRFIVLQALTKDRSKL